MGLYLYNAGKVPFARTILAEIVEINHSPEIEGRTLSKPTEAPLNLPSTVPYHASQMYAKNLATFLQLLVREGKLQINTKDDIIRETLLTQGGEIVNARLRESFSLPPLATKEGA